MTMTKHPYAVRQQTSGYNGTTKYIVVKNPGGSRVSVHPHVTRQSAQADADSLNVSAMVLPHADDPRPYRWRLADAQAKYDAERADTP